MTAIAICLSGLGIFSIPRSLGFKNNSNLHTNNLSSSTLILSKINIRNSAPFNSSAWIITAKISNPSDHALFVPEIQIRAGTPGNRGYITHSYKPVLQKLAPGASFKMKTAIRKTPVKKSEISLAFTKIPNLGI